MLRGNGVLRVGAVLLVGLLGATALTSTADARSRRHHRTHHYSAPSYNPPTASIVVDANSGKVMQATNADSPRHPASLTKMMTLYLLFERLAEGKIKLNSRMEVSEHAAEMAPTKLGLKPGATIAVEDAIKSIVTKSANDMAVVVAETLGGSEGEFAKMMTAKAHALGMTHTSYHNASGLPDDRQITTAHDQAILARALHDRFPQYYPYFSTRVFVYHGEAMRNHNHLLGRVDGVDGLKTGFIHDSGFNIAVSLHRNDRYLIVVVFGGRSAGSRDARVRELIDDNIKLASVKRTAPRIAESREVKPESREIQVAAAGAPGAPLSLSPGSTAPIKPVPVKTVIVKPSATMHTASLLPTASVHRLEAPAAARPVVNPVAAVKHEPPAEPKPAVAAALSAKSAGDEKLRGSATDVAAKAHNGWIIQIGAFDDESDAKQKLAAAQSKVKALLAKADPFTERVEKGDKSLYRARFAGLDKRDAEVACKSLKRSDIPCMLLKN